MNEQPPPVEQQYANLRQYTIVGRRDGHIERLTVLYDDEAAGGPRLIHATEADIRLVGLRGLTAYVRFAQQNGKRVVSWLTIAARDPTRMPTGGIDWQTVRSLSLGDIQREADELIAREERAHRLPPRLMDGLRKRPGRGGRDDLEYALLAAAYVRRLSSHSPVADLARERNVSASTIRDGLSEARRRGLLTRVGKGKAGGRLTPKAVELLKSQKGT